jgi:hypothetical protein
VFREAGYQGGKTAPYARVASLRRRPSKPLVRSKDQPGSSLRLDKEVMPETSGLLPPILWTHRYSTSTSL